MSLTLSGRTHMPMSVLSISPRTWPSAILTFMNARWLILAAALLTVTTGCSSHTAEKQAAAALAMETKCQSRFAQQLHLQGGTKAVSEGFVSDLGNGRFRVTGNVPASAGLDHAESYTCVVASGSSGLRIVKFDVKRAA